MSAPRIVLHHLRMSRGSRIFWLLEELGLSYDVVVHYMVRGAASTMKDVTPLSKSPAVLVDGKLIYESGSIITELLAKFPNANVEATSSSKSTFWGYFSEGSVMLFFQPQMFLGMGAKVTKKSLSPEEAKGADALQQWFNNWSNGHVKMAMDEAERYLGENEWFSGGDKLGLGDFMMLTPVNAVPGIGVPIGPNTKAWLSRVKARPAYQRAVKRMVEEEKKQADKGKL